jgi:predicted enzyme related to lactoylglutathione lyase
MANPVVHFEVIGKDGDKLKSYYSELFGWEINSDNPMKYGSIGDGQGRGPGGEGIGGGIAGGPEGYEGHVTFYVSVESVEEALAKAESLGGERVFGPDKVMDMMILGQFKDPEGHLIGLINPDVSGS